jgi:hypothetical protein
MSSFFTKWSDSVKHPMRLPVPSDEKKTPGNALKAMQGSLVK